MSELTTDHFVELSVKSQWIEEWKQPHAIPIYEKNTDNVTKCVGLYIPEFVQDKEEMDNIVGSKMLTESKQRKDQIGDWSDFLTDTRNNEGCPRDPRNVLSDFDNDQLRVPLKCFQYLTLSSNRIVDMFGVTTSRTCLDNIKLENSKADMLLSAEWSLEELNKRHKNKIASEINVTAESQSHNDTTSNDVNPSDLSSHTLITENRTDEVDSRTFEERTISPGRRKCQTENCMKHAQGATLFCIAHGGGQRCTVDGCSKAARGPQFCSAHGGGKRCNEKNCKNGAVSSSTKCIHHGGGIRCNSQGCSKSCIPGKEYCTKHLVV